MNEGVEWLTITEIEKRTNIPNATIRRYIRKHGHHLNIRKKGKGYLLASEAIEIVLDIRKNYDEGKTVDQVEESLINKARPVTITINSDTKESIDIAVTLQSMQTSIEEQKKITQLLLEQIQKQQEYIDIRLEERDKKLMTAIRENLETKKQLAVTNITKKKQWYRFWRR